MKKFYTTTLGCKINQYETQAIAEAWISDGGVAVDMPDEADIILVNSCAVTSNAVADLRQAVRKLNRQAPQADIIITGCAAQVLAKQLAELPGVTKVVPQDKKTDLLGRDMGKGKLDAGALSFAINDYPRARAVVMVQDGCSYHCAYCIVPLTRGPSISRPIEDIEAEIVRLVEAGFAEIILSGVNLRHFGRDLAPLNNGEKPIFWDLVDRLEATFGHLAGKLRFRLSSLEPGQLGQRALETLSKSRLVAPQLHLSLQSGDDEVLKLMGRGHYKAAPLLDFLKSLEAIWPVYGLGADILLGFPGETQTMFENTLAFSKKLPLSYAHVFPYSPRPNTRAETMANPVEPQEKKRRAKEIRAIAQEKKAAFLERVAGLASVNVVVQDKSGTGVSEYYAPCKFMDTKGLSPRTMVQARPVKIEGGVVLVERIVAERI